MQDVPDGKHMFGIPARPARETMQIVAHQSKLPAMRKEFRALMAQVEELQATMAGMNRVEPPQEQNLAARRNAA
jgi:hypothetical protein